MTATTKNLHYIPGAMPCGHQRPNLLSLRNSGRTELFIWVTHTEIALYGVMYPKSISFRWPNFQELQQMVVPVATSLSYSWGLWYKWLFTLGILQHIQPQPTLTPLHKMMTVQTCWKKLCLLEVKCVYSDNILLCLLSSTKIQRWVMRELWPHRLRDPSFSDSPLKWNDPLWTARSTRWLFPWGKDSQGHLGDIKSLSLFRPNDNLQITLRGIFVDT